MALDKIEFFGAIDKKGKMEGGKISSEFPGYYMDVQKAELEEEISMHENSIKNHLTPDRDIPRKKAEIARLKETLAGINRSQPILKGKDKDTAAKIYEELSAEIGDSLFTRSDMQRGLASPHEEARRMSEPIISISPECASVLQKFNITPGKNKKISRNQASKVWKIMGKNLGEQTNVEFLRKDRSDGTFNNTKYMHEIINE